jgi:DNA-binding CsgD family transcriptional regulator
MRKKLHPLSQREMEILLLSAQGHSNAAIAKAIYASPKTIEAALKSIATKLAAKNIKHAIHQAGNKVFLVRSGVRGEPSLVLSPTITMQVVYCDCW